jgi:murein DD-endopeptidase MepM/ murein hydrolase activator NlpD
MKSNESGGNVGGIGDWLELPILPCVALCVLATLLAVSAGAWVKRQVAEVCANPEGARASPYVLPLAAAVIGEGERIDTCRAAGGARGTHSYDFETPAGTLVVAARSGIVVRVQDNHADGVAGGRQNLVNVRHDDGTIAAYVRLKARSVRVAEGDRIAQGSVIGLSGDTGDGRPALHFAVQACVDCATIPVAFRKSP